MAPTCEENPLIVEARKVVREEFEAFCQRAINRFGDIHNRVIEGPYAATRSAELTLVNTLSRLLDTADAIHSLIKEGEI